MKRIGLAIVSLLLGALSTGAQELPVNMDFNHDGRVDGRDLLILVQMRNASGTGGVSAAEFLAFISHWREQTAVSTPEVTSTPAVTPVPSPVLTPTPSTTAASSPSPEPVVEEKSWAKIENKHIPELSYTNIYGEINVPENFYIQSLSVGVWIKHTISSQLTIEITGPNGIKKRLVGGYSNEGINGYFGKDFPADFADYTGANAKGKWTLTIRDTVQYPDRVGEGDWSRWEIRVKGAPQPFPTNTPTPAVPPSPTPLVPDPVYCISNYFPIANNLKWTYYYSDEYHNGPFNVLMLTPAVFGKTSMAKLKSNQSDLMGDVYVDLEKKNLYCYQSMYHSLSEPLKLGDCTIRNGSTYRQTVIMPFGVYDFTCIWEAVGEQAVPAGVFQDCLHVTVPVVYTATKAEPTNGIFLDWVLAPQIGCIKMGIVDFNLNYLGTAELTDSSLLK